MCRLSAPYYNILINMHCNQVSVCTGGCGCRCGRGSGQRLIQHTISFPISYKASVVQSDVTAADVWRLTARLWLDNNVISNYHQNLLLWASSYFAVNSLDRCGWFSCHCVVPACVSYLSAVCRIFFSHVVLRLQKRCAFRRKWQWQPAVAPSLFANEL